MSEAQTGTERDMEPGLCTAARHRFSDYLDGALDGHTMASLAQHLEQCPTCAEEFATLRAVQAVLGDLGPAAPPIGLQAQLRDVLAEEARRGTHRSPWQQLKHFGQTTLAPLCLRLSAGLGAALVLVGTTTWFIGSAAPVQANDDRLADLHPPSFLYSNFPPAPIGTPRRFVAVMVEARVDAHGKVFDYSILEGPHDAETRARVEENLLGSVFKPATVFGEPVPGHVMITYTAVSVRG